MPTWAWIVVVIAVVIVLALVVAAALRRRRTATLQQRFGPEYERAVGDGTNRREAEADLVNRTRRHEQLDIKPIPESERARYWEEWRVVQEQFVDQPYNAVGVAENLLHRVMAARGYPVEDFEEQSELVSVDHPRVVENYRSAHAVYDRTQTQRATTEDLRQAMVNYRALFDELLARGAEDADAAQYDADTGNAQYGNARYEGGPR